MFFTQEDYRKIEKWLLANSVKDTEFAGASLPLKGNETVAFVQDGKNVNVLLKDLIEQIFLLGVSDFLNVTDKYGESRISLTQAIQLIPYKSRKIGQVITFLDKDGEWKLFQFQGERVNQWNNATLWVDLIERIQGISIIDSEDITATVDNLNQTSLTFADKNYNTTDYSGLGRVYLRKNIQRVQNPNTGIFYNTNLLTQQMISKENTIYIIQYDYSLNYQTITIPGNCILQFEGGSIDKGTINGNNSIIYADLNSIRDINIQGLWNNKEISTNIFKEKNAKAIKNALVLSNRVLLEPVIYEIDTPIQLISNKIIEGIGENCVLKATSNVECVIDLAINDGNNSIQNLNIRNFTIDGDNKAVIGIKCNYLSFNSELTHLNVYRCLEAGLSVTKAWYCSFNTINSWYNKYGLFITGESSTVNSISFNNCTFNYNNNAAFITNNAGYDIQFISCTFENSTEEHIVIDKIYQVINFIGCYCEGNTTCLKIVPTYNNSAGINIVGGYYNTRLSEYTAGIPIFNIGKIGFFNMYGVHCMYFSNSSDYMIVTNALTNHLIFTTTGGLSASSLDVKATGQVIGHKGKDWGQADEGSNATSWHTPLLNVLSNDGYGKDVSASLFIGSLKSSNFDVGYNYQYYLKYNRSSNSLGVFQRKKTSSNTFEDTLIAEFVNNQLKSKMIQAISVTDYKNNPDAYLETGSRNSSSVDNGGLFSSKYRVKNEKITISAVKRLGNSSIDEDVITIDRNHIFNIIDIEGNVRNADMTLASKVIIV